MLKPEKKTYKRTSLIATTIVLLLALLAIPTTVVLTAEAENQAPTESVDADNIFGNATNLGPTVNSSANDFDPSISADGLELYFNSYRPGGFDKADIWVTTRKTKAGPWGEPVNLGATINSPAHENAPNISADGLSLYFNSNRPGGQGIMDIWVTRRKSTSESWGIPVNLGPTVNSTGWEGNPDISRDGSTLYFSSYRSGGSGSTDLWMVPLRKPGAKE